MTDLVAQFIDITQSLFMLFLIAAALLAANHVSNTPGLEFAHSKSVDQLELAAAAITDTRKPCLLLPFQPTQQQRKPPIRAPQWIQLILKHLPSITSMLPSTLYLRTQLRNTLHVPILAMWHRLIHLWFADQTFTFYIEHVTWLTQGDFGQRHIAQSRHINWRYYSNSLSVISNRLIHFNGFVFEPPKQPSAFQTYCPGWTTITLGSTST